MAPPACDHPRRVRKRRWSEDTHRQCLSMQRDAVRLVLLQNRWGGDQTFGLLPRELCLAILRRVQVECIR